MSALQLTLCSTAIFSIPSPLATSILQFVSGKPPPFFASHTTAVLVPSAFLKDSFTATTCALHSKSLPLFPGV